MLELPTGFRDFRQRLLARPDALMLELGAGGELLVAQIRAWLSLALLALPLANQLGGGALWESLAGLSAVTVAIVCSQLWLALARRRGRYGWLPWATTTYDISLTTLALAGLATQSPPIALNSMVVWVLYPLSIAMTALRNDGRLTLYAGALAFGQYLLLVLLVFQLTTPEQRISLEYGTVTVSNQVQRLVLVLLMTALTAAIVYRMQRLVDLSGSDGLTGLPNRTWLVHRFQSLLEDARREATSLSVCLLDLDYFKRVNDEAGHPAGDRALHHVAQVLSEQLQPGEILARLGGEEFVVVLPHPLGHAWERAEALRRTLAAHPFVAEPGEPPRRLTFSAGVASWPLDGSDLSGLLRRADARLRQAKRAGRNRCLARDD